MSPKESVEISKSCITCSGSFSGDLSVCPEDGTPLTALVEDWQPGSIIAEKYEILEVIGTGGMGKVYKAKHMLMNRIVAIKSLLPQAISNAIALKRFQQEAQAASALNHPHILTVYDFGITSDGLPYLVMDFLEGTTLNDAVIDVGYMPVRRALPIFLQVCDGLAHAHQNGVIHRDLKPTNIMLIDYGGNPDFVKIVDFGIAKVMPKDDTDSSNSEQLTQTGEIFGSPLYMSPEQCQGKQLDCRSDIYSFGCVMFRTLCGKPPFSGENRMDAMFKQIKEDAPRLADVSPDLSVSSDLEAIVLKCLHKDPDARYATMTELAVDLEALPEYHTIANRATIRTSQIGIAAQVAPSRTADDAEATSKFTTSPQTPVQNTDQASAQHQSTISISMPPRLNAILNGTADLWRILVSKLSQPPGSAPGGAPGGEGTLPASGSDLPKPAGSRRSQEYSGLLKVSLVLALLALLGTGIYFSFSNKETAGLHSTSPAVKSNATNMAREAEKLVQKGRYAKAEQLAGQALKLATDEKDLPGSVAASATLAYIYLHEFKYKDAWTYAKWIMEVKEHGQPVDDFHYADALNTMGIIATLEKKYPDAHRLLDQAQKIREKFSGSYRTYYARTLAAQGNLARAEGHYTKAIALLQEARHIAEPISGMGDIETQGIVNDLGQAYQFAGRLGAAEECYLTALDERQRSSDPDSPAIAESQICLAFLRAKQGRTEESVRLFERALAIYDKAFGKNSSAASELCYAFASVFDSQKKYPLAQTYYQESLQMRLASLKPNDPLLLDTQKKYQAVLRKLKKR